MFPDTPLDVDLVPILSIAFAHIYQSFSFGLISHMSSSLESKAYFEARCKTVGLADDIVDKLNAAGVNSLASVAFFTTYQPGGQDDAALVTAASKALDLDPVPGPVIIALRRLHYESHAMYVADLKHKVSSTEEELPKRVPNAERAARHIEQKARLRGLNLEGEFECSHSLLDIVAQQFERDELRYVPISACATREQELTGIKKDSQLALDSEGQLKLKPSVSLAVADTTTDLKLKNALTRRGISYDQSGLLDFTVHSQWVDKLFSIQTRTPPPGYRQVSINQLLEADKEMWKRMADSCRTGIVPSPGYARPLDLAMCKHMESSEVMYFLLPLPASSSARETTYGPVRDYKKGDGKKGSGKKGDHKGSGKKGDKSKGTQFNSEALGWPAGTFPKLKSGQHFCFPFNTAKGCNKAKTGARCPIGWHLCAKRGCEGKHSAVGCAANS